MAKKTKLLGDLKFINQLKKRLQAEPSMYNQQAYKPDDDATMCGTPVCVAGHAYLLAGHTVLELKDADNDEICRVASTAMGLTPKYTEILFNGMRSWPSIFQWNDDARAKKKVEIACAHIDAVVAAARFEDAHPDVAAVLLNGWY